MVNVINIICCNGPNWRKTVSSSSTVKSPISQEGLSERTFPNFAFSSLFFIFFPDFDNFSPIFLELWQSFCCHSAPPLDPRWLRHWAHHFSPPWSANRQMQIYSAKIICSENPGAGKITLQYTCALARFDLNKSSMLCHPLLL